LFDQVPLLGLGEAGGAAAALGYGAGVFFDDEDDNREDWA
jgi:hypothetical protein